MSSIESAASLALVSLASVFLVPTVYIFSAASLVVLSTFNLASRLPGISAFETMQRFTEWSNDINYRSIKVILVALPVIFLFLSEASIQTALPGLLGKKNLLARATHQVVKPLGRLNTIRAVVPRVTTLTGSRSDSLLSLFEDFFRILSYKNKLEEVQANKLTHCIQIPLFDNDLKFKYDGSWQLQNRLDAITI